MANFPINTLPGIKRDGTLLEGNYYTDGEWCRFQRGKPRSIGGYMEISNQLGGVSRGVFIVPRGPVLDVYSGNSDTLEYIETNLTGSAGGLVDRTPVGFGTDANNVWQFDLMYDATNSVTRLIAHAAPNLDDINNTTETTVWYGDAASNAKLITTGEVASGGIVVIHPYLFLLTNEGTVKWSQANQPAIFAGGDSGSARITGNKILKGLQVRTGAQSGGGLLWSIDSLIKVTYVGGSAIFSFDTITDKTSLLSSSSVVEYNGVYFWPTTSSFVYYNGVVRTLKNDMNRNFFFENLNYAYRQKVWGLKVEEYNEIWWFYPRIIAGLPEPTECNWAVIYNLQLDTWYDTPINRSAGYYSEVFPYPVMADSVPLTPAVGSKYQLWLHEIGEDQVIGLSSLALKKTIETGDISFCATGPEGKWMGQERDVRITRLEPDAVQTGDMSFYVTGKKFARSSDQLSVPYLMEPTTQKIDLHEERRQMRLRFESNTLGGAFQLGENIIHLESGDVRP